MKYGFINLVFAIYSEKRKNHSFVDCFDTCKQYDFNNMILRTTNESRQAMQEKTNSKIVAEITSKDSKIKIS